MESGQQGQRHGILESSRLETVYANIFEVICTGGEVIAQFGNLLPEGAGAADRLEAKLAARIVMNPLLAKRTSRLLNRKISQYEAAFGELTEEISVDTAPPCDSLTATTTASGNEATAIAARMQTILDGLGVSYSRERSFKISSGSLLTNRFICGFKKSDLHAPAASLVAAFRQLEMPEHLQQECLQQLDRAVFIHFGLEEQQDCCICKAYLEFDTTLKYGADVAIAGQDPFVLYLGFKWVPGDSSRSVTSQYTCYPLISLEQLCSRLDRLYAGTDGQNCLQLVKDMLHTKVRLISRNKLIYEEVAEEGNPRRSFDLNLYAVNLYIKDIQPFLSQVGRQYRLPVEQFTALCHHIADKRFGHLSGGVDRYGSDFLTVYYGATHVERPHP